MHTTQGLGECTYEEDLHYLKQKVDAGADFIISQLFFDTERYIKWVADCRAIGIVCPIVPGILPVQSWRSFSRMCELNPTVSVPSELRETLEPLKTDDQAVREYGVKFATQQCRQLLDSGAAKGIHFYTINLEVATAKIVGALGWAPEVCLMLVLLRVFCIYIYVCATRPSRVCPVLCACAFSVGTVYGVRWRRVCRVYTCIKCCSCWSFNVRCLNH
jgi:Methylenetetrahydrofolate reductase